MIKKLHNPACLVIGATGLVGKHLGALLSKNKIPWVGTFHKRPLSGLQKLDITNKSEVKNFILKFSPRAVFHCANLAGGVNFCESHPGEATEFHLNATKNIGAQCKAVDAIMVYVSSDYVFDGTKDCYKEEDLPNPLNIYGRLKLEAEQWISTNLKNYLIARTTNIYGWDPETTTPNYMMSLYRTLKEKKKFDAPSLLWGNPTYVGDLAASMLELYAKGACGIFHIVGTSFVNRFEWAKKGCEILMLDKTLLNEIKKPPYGAVPRPLKSCLNADKFTKSYETILHNLSDGLKLMKTDMET